MKPPSLRTLQKYGLSAQDWLGILERQGNVCAVCRKVPKSNRLNVDHEHVRGFKKLPPEKKRHFVRGLLCFWCNKTYVGRAITIEKAQNVIDYLRDHRERVVLAGLGLG